MYFDHNNLARENLVSSSCAGHPSHPGHNIEKLQVQSVGEADCEYKAIYPRKKFSMNLTTLTSKFSAIN